MSPDPFLSEAGWRRIPADLREKVRTALERRDRRVVDTPAAGTGG